MITSQNPATKQESTWNRLDHTKKNLNKKTMLIQIHISKQFQNWFAFFKKIQKQIQKQITSHVFIIKETFFPMRTSGTT